uniref:uncharacterized protein C15orf61 homolog isoform X3 n=1 Tax=Doryrhamphus excisus TaxID=161450 RepID=UPI0025ADFBBB|nr:uncharacterized protein C15orf61 homolog isoform X3 [Doryrhamphus excisus]
MGQPFKVSMCKQAPEGRFHMAPRPHSSAILDVNENRKMAVIDHATTSCLWEVTSSMKHSTREDSIPEVFNGEKKNYFGHRVSTRMVVKRTLVPRLCRSLLSHGKPGIQLPRTANWLLPLHKVPLYQSIPTKPGLRG